jgi:hypothetical protein
MHKASLDRAAADPTSNVSLRPRELDAQLRKLVAAGDSPRLETARGALFAEGQSHYLEVVARARILGARSMTDTQLARAHVIFACRSRWASHVRRPEQPLARSVEIELAQRRPGLDVELGAALDHVLTALVDAAPENLRRLPSLTAAEHAIAIHSLVELWLPTLATRANADQPPSARAVGF